MLKDRFLGEFYHLPEKDWFPDLAYPITGEEDAHLSPGRLQDLFFFLSKNIFEMLDQISGFYTILPFSRLCLLRFRDGTLLGLVRLTRAASFPSYLRQHPVVLLRKDGTLAGLNRAFAEKLDAKTPDPKGLLLKPVRELLSDDPLQGLMAAGDGVQAQWRPETALKNRLIEAGEKERERVIRIGKADLAGKDLKITLSFKLLKGEPPVFLLTGADYDNEMLPDYEGYLLGYHAGRQAFQIKKCGRVLHEAPYQTAFPPGDYFLEAIRRGAFLQMSLNGRAVIGFNDMNVMEYSPAHLFLYFRKASAIALSSLEISVAPKDIRNTNMNGVSFLNGTENSYLFYSYLDLFTDSSKEHFYGLVFYDVSPLKKDLSVLRQERARIENERDRYRALAASRREEQDGFVGEDPAVRTILESAAIAAASNAAVLIEGETGTGKEVLARFIHDNSPFREGPFVKVDCSTLPENLVESELFGYEKGAFTGALEGRKGKLETAHRGTLFIDEIGNLKPDIQAKLLAFLQDLTVTRLGSNTAIRVETRVVAAANRPVQDLIQQGRFRPDLYYRLNSVRFTLPPLRERKEDIPLLAVHFLKEFSRKFRRLIRGFSAGAFRRLLSHNWPGNVRELQNAVQKAVLFCSSPRIEESHLDLIPAGEPAPAAVTVPAGDSRALKREHLLHLLEKHNWIIKRAAAEAGVSLPTFFRKMRRFEIRRKGKRK